MAGPFDKINAALSGKQAAKDSNPSGTVIGRSTAEFTRARPADKSMADHADEMHPVKPRKQKVVYGADWDQ